MMFPDTFTLSTLYGPEGVQAVNIALLLVFPKKSLIVEHKLSYFP